MCINNRKNASVNPLAIERTTYEELAEKAGMSLEEYMNSPYNPKMGDFLRAGGLELKCDGAAAVIVCATEKIPEIAPNLKHKPIEVLGIGSAACEATTPHFEVRATQEAVKQVYELTGMNGNDLDLFYANDFIITSHLVSAEIAGYFHMVRDGNIFVKDVLLGMEINQSIQMVVVLHLDMRMQHQVLPICMKLVNKFGRNAVIVM